jgi:ribosomal protein S18 acetylase RimI-like enzyme
LRIRRADAAETRRQATWIVAMEPWVSMGYQAAPLGRWLQRRARAGWVWVAVEGDIVLGLLVMQPDFLLGNFIALVAVSPAHAGRGVGRALVQRAQRLTFAKRRWLYVSCDGLNQGAARFYKKLGFARVARLPDLVCPGRTEILWRRARG